MIISLFIHFIALNIFRRQTYQHGVLVVSKFEGVIFIVVGLDYGMCLLKQSLPEVVFLSRFEAFFCVFSLERKSTQISARNKNKDDSPKS